MKSLVRLFRPHQYIKNLFIFAPIIFSFSFTVENSLKSIFAFILFCFLASAVYILNDIEDVLEDRKHPKKRFRPIASGEVSVALAWKIFFMIAGIVLFITALFSLKLLAVFLIYLLLNIAYTKGLKHIAILDIFIIATGFVLRLFAGSVVTGIYLSHWIIMMTFLLAIFLALAKRRDDVLLSLEGRETRKNIDGYNLEFINASMILMAGVVIVSYILYTVSDEVVSKFHNDNLYLTSFFVILGVLRYMQITFVKEDSGSPTKVVLKDRFLKLTILFWLFSFIGIIKYL
jgi:4-hydroxybenzoate polyprenyltransferase